MWFTIMIGIIILVLATAYITKRVVLKLYTKDPPKREVVITEQRVNFEQYKDVSHINIKEYYQIDIETLIRIKLNAFKKALPDECFNVNVEKMEDRPDGWYRISISTFIGRDYGK